MVNQNFAELDQKVFLLLQKFGYNPEIIFDVGASNGSWSAKINEIFPTSKYYLFEPLADYPEYHDKLQHNLKIFPNFELHKLALGDIVGETTMNIFPNLVGSTALEISNKEGREQKQVKVMALDNFIKVFEIPIPQVLKVDTQGFELSILKGAEKILPQVNILLLECWLFKGYGKNTPLLADIIQYLYKFGFVLFDLTDCYRNPDGVLANQDCVFINTNLGLFPKYFYE